MITDIQKASLLKRVAAGIFDGILLCILAVGFAWLLTSAMDYDGNSAKLLDSKRQYEQAYGVSFDITQEQYDALSEAERANYDAASKACNADPAVQQTFNLLYNIILLSITFSILLAVAVLEFFIPLILKNGQTVGKKIFSIGLIRVDSVQLTTLQLFVRSILGKYTIELMIPVYLILMMFVGMPVGAIGVFIIGAIVLAQIILLIVTPTNSMIHDKMAGTVAVDLASQMVFRTTQDLIAYKAKIHAEQAARSNYK
ncbi:MAG: RDD family protein [Oscillospiraceae bacterium]|nr:RDD family protein [Oscillospiraceae bacterium]